MDGDESEEGIVDDLESATAGVGGEDVEAVTEAVDGVELGEAGLTPFCRPLSVMLMKRWSTVVTYQSLLWRQKCRTRETLPMCGLRQRRPQKASIRSSRHLPRLQETLST